MKMNKQCQNCGTYVSNKFVEVYGDNNGTLHHCIECIDSDDGGRELLRKGAGAKEDLMEVTG